MGESDLMKIRSDFPILSREVHGKRLVYLDNAATTMKPEKVIRAVSGHYREEASNVHRGLHYLSGLATRRFEDARSAVRRFIHAASDHEVVFTRGTTESINLVAQAYGRHFLKRGDAILVSEMEHHSNIVPWQLVAAEKGLRLKVIPMDDMGELCMGAFEGLLADGVKLVAVTYISNALGTVNPVREIVRMARDAGAVVLVDAAQAASHVAIDVGELDCDFLAFSGHKMFGPTGIGVLYGKEELLDAMPPFQGGGEMIRRVTFEKTTYNSLPYKFEAGTPPIAQAIGLAAAVEYIGAVGFPWIVAHERALGAHAALKLGEIEGVKIIGTAGEKAALCSFVYRDIHPHDLGTFLDREGIAVRTGHHCAQPVMDHFGIPATTRASCSLYTTREEIDYLAGAIVRAGRFFK